MELLPEPFGERGDFQQGFLWFDSLAQPQAAAAAGGGGGAANGTLFTQPNYSQLQSPIQPVPPMSAPLMQPLVQPMAPLQPPPPLPGASFPGLPPLPLPQSMPQSMPLPLAPPAPLQAAPQPMQLVPIDSLHAGAASQPSAGQLSQQEIVVEQVAGQAVGQLQQPIVKEEEQLELGAGGGGGGRGGGRGRGRGGGRGRVSEEERKARNRATQARFRERQKVRQGGGGGGFRFRGVAGAGATTRARPNWRLCPRSCWVLCLLSHHLLCQPPPVAAPRPAVCGACACKGTHPGVVVPCFQPPRPALHPPTDQE